jgi:putative protein-disulfide isomerase
VNVADLAVLGELAAGFGEDAAAFTADLATEAVKEETWRDYAISRGAGVSGFPTLIFGPQADATYVAVARGFQPAEQVLQALAHLVAGD